MLAPPRDVLGKRRAQAISKVSIQEWFTVSVRFRVSYEHADFVCA